MEEKKVAMDFLPIIDFNEEDNGLPLVLLVGDSIVSSYKETVIRELEGVANVNTWITGAHHNAEGLHEQVKYVITSKKYNLIHFNIGLHSWPEGRIPEGQYEILMRKYVDTYKKYYPQSQLIWASTTPVTEQEKPENLDMVINPIIEERNQIDENIMRENGIIINDLYGLMITNLKYAIGDRFHWNREGKVLQGKKVANIIRENLIKLEMT